MNLTHSGVPLSPQDITVFEREIGGRLPEDYKQFLLECNGGMVEPEVGFRWEEDIRVLPGFFMLLQTPDSGLRRALWELRELGIDGFLPIASTRNEEDICLAFSENIGSVWLALYEYEDDHAVDARMAPLASSFTEFLDSLAQIPVVYCPIEELGEKGAPEDLVRYLAQGNPIDTVGKNGLTILCEAIKFDNMPMIKACIEHGASLSQSIYIATCNQRPDLIRMLADAGADVNERDAFGKRPLYFAQGTGLPGEEGAVRRKVRGLLIELGGTE